MADKAASRAWKKRTLYLWAPVVVVLGCCYAVRALPFARAKRSPAAEALLEARAKRSPAAEALLELDSVSFSVRQPAIESLVDMGAPAVRELIAALDGPNRRIARGAVEALGAIGDRRATGPLTALLVDEDPLIRAAAALALARLRDGRAVEPLIGMLRETYPGMAQVAARALGEIGDDRAVEPLKKIHEDPDAPAREAAGEALAQIADAADAGAGRIESLIARLAAGDAPARKRAASALIAADGEAVEPLIVALQDASWEVRRGAAEALGEIGDPRAVEPLIAALAQPSRPSPGAPAGDGAAQTGVRKTVAEALGKLGHPSAVEPLIAALADDDPSVRGSAAAALGRIADARAVEPLADAAFTDKNRGVQLQAVMALGEIGDPRGVEALSLVVTDARRSGLHWKAAEALGRIGDPRAADALIVLMEHPRTAFWVRHAAITALGKVKNPCAVQPLIALIRQRGGPIRGEGLLGQAIVALGEIGDPAAADTLIGLLDEEPAPSDQVVIGRALANIDDDRARHRLLDAFEKRRPHVITGGFAFFVAWGEEKSESVLIETLEGLNWPRGDFSAAVCLQSGNEKLRRAAQAWVREHCPRPQVYDPSATTEAVPWRSARDGSARNGRTP